MSEVPVGSVCNALGNVIGEPTVRALPLFAALHVTVADPFALIVVTSETMTVMLVAEYGVTTLDAAPRICVMVVASMVWYCEVGSATVRAANVVLNCTARPFPSSTLPRYNTTMIGRISANSTADTPRRSPQKRRNARRWRAGLR